MTEALGEAGEAGRPALGQRGSAAARRAATELSHDRVLALATAMLGLLVVLALFGPLAWSKDPLEVDIGAILQAPSVEHPMGTDSVGRDVFSRFNEGARISLTVGAVAVLVGGAVGSLIGIVSGALGGWIDTVLMRVMDSVLAFPPLILAMAVTVGLGVGLVTATIGVILTSVPYYARLMRADVISVRSSTYVEAAAALGASRKRVIARHVLPNAFVSVPILAAANFGYAILTLAALGFVGLGAQIPTPEWGTMITEGQDFIVQGRWWVGVFPGLGVLIAVTGGSLIADRMRQVLDPREGPIV